MNGPVPEFDEVALRQALERVLQSSEFGKREKLARFLRYVVEATLARESDNLKQHTIAVDALGYAPGESSDAAVRAHALRLRKALESYYHGEGSADPIIIELPKGRYVPSFRNRQAPHGPATVPAQPPFASTWGMRGVLLSLLAMGLAATAIVVDKVGYKNNKWIEQLTFEEADVTGPVVTPDGRFLVYSSDEAPGGGRDIWVMDLHDRGKKRRLTSHPSDDYDPDVSSDLLWVVFRSMRDGGGVYIVPLTGGQAVRLSPGFRPRFAPNGRQIAYAKVEDFGNLGVWVQPIDGEPKRVSAGLQNASCPVWSPDSQRLIVHGTARSSDSGIRQDWWILSADGSTAPQPVFATKALPQIATNTGGDPCPEDWLEHRVLNASGALREVRLDSNLRVKGEAEILHPGPGVVTPRYTRRDVKLRYVCFALRKALVNVWGASLAVADGHQRKWEPWTDDATISYDQKASHASLSRDGTRLSFLSKKTGIWAVWMKHRKARHEWLVASGADDYGSPILNGNGDKVAYWERSAGRTSISITDVAANTWRRVCYDCGELRSWSGDGKRMLSVSGRRLLEIDTAKGVLRDVVDLAGFDLEYAAYSPDGRWIALSAGVKGGVQGWVIPALGGDRKNWALITEEPYDLAMQWSPAGDMLYYFSRKEDHRCLWGQPLDPKTKRPVGSPVAIEHFHGSLRVWQLGWVAASGGWLAINGTQATGYLFRLSR